jgi:hypothetical protein
MTLMAQDLALRDLGLATFLRPRPDGVMRFGIGVDVVQLQLLLRSASFALLVPKEVSPALGDPGTLVVL